jgi:ribosomal protein S18 acetylase RimI-like enzyme
MIQENDTAAFVPADPAGAVIRYLATADGTGVFRPEELEVLEEVLEDAWNNPETTYIVFEEPSAHEPAPAGFIIFGRTPMTAFAWDMYWIVVEKKHQGQGIGRKLLERMERALRAAEPKSVIRVETAGRPEYEATRAFYRRTGFIELGAIPAFYEEGDDLVMFYKTISRT